MARNEQSRPADDDLEPLQTEVTSEVGAEGGSPGDVEIEEDTPPSTGSESGETSHPTTSERREIVRDETGVGRRSP